MEASAANARIKDLERSKTEQMRGPADEIGAAWNEGFKSGSEAGVSLLTGQRFKDGVEAWLESRAKRVMEGEV